MATHTTPFLATEERTSKTAFGKKDAHALEGALAELGIEVRYNLRAMRCQIKRGSNEWEKTSDRLSADLRREIADKFEYKGQVGRKDLRFSLESWNEHLNALLYHREVDPFKSWLESLPPWDHKNRLSNLLQECLGLLRGR